MFRDVETALAENRAILRWLVERLVETSLRSRRIQLFRDFGRALGGHIRAIDEVLIPALKTHGWKDVPMEALLRHVKLKRQLAELLAMGRDEARLDAALLSFLAQFEAHQEQERQVLVPLIHKLLGEDEAASLGAQVEAQFGMLFDTAPDNTNAGDVRGLVDEARIVLSTLPTQSP